MRLRHLRRLHEDESGVITAYFVVISLVLFGIMAFALDIGILHLQRRVAQNAADPGSFAGAAYLERCTLWDDETDPADVAAQYATNNLDGIGNFALADDDAIFATVVDDGFSFTDEFGTATYDTVYTRVDRQQSYLFGRFLGLTSANVPAEAEAACLPTEGLNVCPFFLEAPDPDWQVEDGGDPFGIKLGMVYRFKDGGPEGDGGNRGFLRIYGQGGSDINRGIENGCVPTDGTVNIWFEGGESVTATKPGTLASIWSSMDDLYEYEGNPNPPYEPQSYCDVDFDINAFVVEDQTAFTPPTDPLFDDKVVDCRLDPDPLDNVEGRWWPILITPAPCIPSGGGGGGGGGTCTVPILSVAMMYVACWGPRCDGSNPGQAGLYGVFMDDVPFELPASGISNNPLTPQRVRLIR